jgi:HK97 gp10 family phage protein
MVVTFDPDRAYNAIVQRVTGVVNATLIEVTESAKERAPVRKVFKGGTGRATVQSIEEAAAEAATRSRLGLAPGRVRTQRSPAARVHAFGPRRLLVSPAPSGFDVSAGRHRSSTGRFISASQARRQAAGGRLRFDTPTTTRGRYEIRTGRANIRIGGKTFVGGRLRSEITYTPASVDGGLITGHVVSPTPYAKYVEFGTRHSRAQPYLRPAFASQRAAFRGRLERVV